MLKDFTVAESGGGGWLIGGEFSTKESVRGTMIGR